MNMKLSTTTSLMGRVNKITRCVYHCTATYSTQTQTTAQPSTQIRHHNRHHLYLRNHFQHSGLFLHRNATLTYNCQRYKSTTPAETGGVISATDVKVEYIPEPPSAIETVTDQLSGLAEPTLSSLGLCNYTPAGAVQAVLEFLHVSVDLPWWSSLAIFSVGLRFLVLPLHIYAIKVGINGQNAAPTFMKYQDIIKKAEMQKDVTTAMVFSAKLQDHIAKHNYHPVKQILPMCYQGPIFISVLYGIRGMAGLPVQSMTTGGMYWFTDLTVADPYFILPLLTASAFLLNVELGAEGFKPGQQPSSKKRWAFRAFIGIGVPVFMSFSPSALAVYWLTSSLTAIAIANTLKIPAVKKVLNMPEPIKTEKKFERREGKQGFGDAMKGIMTTAKQARKTYYTPDLEQMGAKNFHEAGRAKVVKTFKHKPT